MNKIILSLILLMVFSCSDNPSETPEFNSGIGGNDDLNPGPGPSPTPSPQPTPTPEPTPAPIVELERILPSDLNEKETTLVYRRFFLKTAQLGISSDHRYCDKDYQDKCLVNKQLIFHFPTDNLNTNYPKELWDVTKISFTGSFFSVGENKRTELFCNLNLRKCSGRAIEKVFGIKFPKVIFRNGSFWRGDEKAHIMNDKFHELLELGKVRSGLYIRNNLNLNLSNFLKLDYRQMNTLVRKNEKIEFSVTDDTYVEDPNLEIEFTRRLPRSD